MIQKFSLHNKNIIITGASSGIGKKCAEECNKAGANIILTGRNEARLKTAFDKLSGSKNLFYSFDITQFDIIEDIVNEIVEKTGKIDGFIHSAGIELTKPFRLTKTEDYENLYKVNVISGFEFAKVISSRKYINETGGSFVFISSVLGFLSKPGIISYSSSKGALINGAKSMALELASKKIRVNCISPAVVETELSKSYIEKLTEEAMNDMLKMHPLGLGKPEDVAYACIYLLSDESRWVTGSNLVIDGGYSIK